MEELRELFKEFIYEVKKNYHIIFNASLNSFSFKRALIPSPDQNLNRYYSNSMSGMQINYIDWHYVSCIIKKEIIKLRSTRKIFDYIQENDLSWIKRKDFEEDCAMQPSISGEIISAFIGRMVELSENFELEDQYFDTTINQLINYFQSETISVQTLISLRGPLGDFGEIDLESNVIIKHATYDQSKLFCIHYSSIDTHSYEVLENDYLVEINRTILKKNINQIHIEEDGLTNKLLNVFALSNKGNIEIGKILHISDAWPAIRTRLLRIPMDINKYGRSNLFRYVFEKSSAEAVKENYEQMKTIDFAKLDEKILSALRRLKKGKSIFNIEDRIIELSLALEYIINTQPSEVTLQLCLKMIKMYNHQNTDEQLYSHINKFYALRSKVVHGNASVTADEKNLEVIEKLEEILIKVLTKFILLNQKYTFSEISKALNKSLYVNKSVEEILMKA